MRRSFSKSIFTSLMVVYSASVVVLPKGRYRQRKPSFPTIAMHVDNFCAFEWTCWYAAPRSIFSISMSFECHLINMTEITQSIIRKQNS